MRLNSISYNFFSFAFIFLALWPNGSCKSGKTDMMSQKQNRVAIGNWGGQNIRLEVTEAGAQLQFSCAHGNIDLPLTLDHDGNFSVKGTIVAEAMGPLREDNPPKPQPATYSGTVHDQTMTLTITITGSNEKPGTYSLEQGKPGRVFKCH
jgi:hypothetical protein